MRPPAGNECNAESVPLVVVGLVSGEVEICGETSETISFTGTVAVSRRHQRAGSTSGLTRLIETLITLDPLSTNFPHELTSQ
jgi:hypothetical protein